jgi:DNA-3-methyladenine glycosylase II
VESATRISTRARHEAVRLVRSTLGLAVDLRPFYRLAHHDAVIGSLVRRFRGMRPPRFPNVFESLVNSIAVDPARLEDLRSPPFSRRGWAGTS